MEKIIIFYIVVLGPLCLLCGPASFITWIIFPFLPFIISHFFGDHKDYNDMTWEEKREYEYQKEYKACIKDGIGYIKADEVARQKAERLVPDPNIPPEPDLSIPKYCYWGWKYDDGKIIETFDPPKGNKEIWYCYDKEYSKIEKGRMIHWFNMFPKSHDVEPMGYENHEKYKMILIRASFDQEAAEKEFRFHKFNGALYDPRFFPEQLIELDEI